MPSQPLPFDPVAEARRHWVERWSVGEHMAAATSLMRVHQLVLAAVEDELRPFGLTFSSYEALMLLSFTAARRDAAREDERPPDGRTRRASRTRSTGWRRRASSQRRRDLSDKRRILAVITAAGRQVAAEATEPLNKIQFGLGVLDEADAATVNGVLRPCGPRTWPPTSPTRGRERTSLRASSRRHEGEHHDPHHGGHDHRQGPEQSSVRAAGGA